MLERLILPRARCNGPGGIISEIQLRPSRGAVRMQRQRRMQIDAAETQRLSE